MILSGNCANFGNKKSSHARSSATAQRVSQLKSLETIAGFRFFAYNIEDGIDKFSTFCVMTFGPVVAGSRLAETKLSGRKTWPKGPDRTESMVPGSKSTRMARGQRKGRKGMGPYHKVGTIGQRWKNQVSTRDLPFLPSNQRVRDYRLLYWTRIER